MMMLSTDEHSPLISIIIGVYNGEKFLHECIKSTLNQTYENIEIILINDGSKDSSQEIINKYAEQDRRIRAVHKQNTGVSDSRNLGLELSKGEYICIVDQDDCISADYIAFFYQILSKNKAEIAIAITVDKFWGVPNTEKSYDKKIELWSGEKAAIEMLYHKIIIAPWNKMISKRLITENNLWFNEQYFCGEGFAFSIECFLKANKVAVSNRKIYHYRVGDPESGASKFKKETIYSSINAQRYIYEILEPKTDELVLAWNFSNWHTHCDCLNIMIGCNVVQKEKELYAALKKECKNNALCALKAPVSLQQKSRGILFKINPKLAGEIINQFRMRKFHKER